MGKGDNRRPRDEKVSEAEYERRWERAFNPERLARVDKRGQEQRERVLKSPALTRERPKGGICIWCEGTGQEYTGYEEGNAEGVPPLTTCGGCGGTGIDETEGEGDE